MAQQPSARRREAVWLAAILLLALAARLWGLGAKSLWLDEVMTVHKATSSFGAMMEEVTKTDAHPPLFQIMEWLWLRLGRGDAFARLPSVFLGVAAVWLTFLTARRIAGRRTAIAAGVVMAFSYFQIFYSQEARLHELVTVLFLAQTYLLLRIVAQRRAGWGLWMLYALAGLLSLYTYALCILTIGALALLYVLLMRKRGPQWWKWFVAHLLIGVVFLPWYWFVLRVTTAKLEESVRRLGDAVGGPTASQLLSGVASWGVGPTDWSFLPTLGVLLGAALLIAAAVALYERRSRRPALVLGVLFLAPLLGYLLLPMPRVHIYEAKHLIFLQPLLIIALCSARRRVVVERAVPSALAARAPHAPGESASDSAVRTPRSTNDTPARVSPVVYVAITLLALNLFNLSDYFSPSFQKEDWRGLTRYVETRLLPGDLVLFNPGYVGYAFNHYQTEGRDIPQSPCEPLVQGQALEGRFSRIWLITCRSPVSHPYTAAQERLLKEGWTRYDEATFVSRAWPGGLTWTLLTRAEAGHD